jgi:hypothetical protein
MPCRLGSVWGVRSGGWVGAEVSLVFPVTDSMAHGPTTVLSTPILMTDADGSQALTTIRVSVPTAANAVRRSLR